MSEGHTERLEAALDGKYRIERKLGEGGMASVYLAEDIKHERKVALKILKPELAAVIGADRFLSEIKTTANLQHPHILALFDSGEAAGYLYYVMPYIEGETLREKLNREKQLGVEESVRIAQGVADALDYAHRHDVIHRDIKPGNILLHDGRPVVADFGIALAVSAAGGGRMTETGLSLGTPHYMSPEQASADRDLSARSDIYSLGCVLYEMIGGQPPHTGPSAQSILVHILTKEVSPLTELRHTVPPSIAAAVAKAIEKLPADRFETAKQFMEALGDEGFTYGGRTRTTTTIGEPLPGRAPASAQSWMRDGRSVALFILGLGMSGLAAWGWLRSPQPVASEASRLSVYVPTGHRLLEGQFPTLAISHDGNTLAFQTDGAIRLRSLASFDAEQLPLAGRVPFFSPDDQWVGAADGLVRLSDNSLLQSRFGVFGASWSPDGTIIRAEGIVGQSGLVRVSAEGGESRQLTTVDDSELETGHVWPQVLPDGAGVLFTVLGPSGGWTDARIAVLAEGADRHRYVAVGREATFARYVPTGHLLYTLADGTVMAARFDLEELAVTGPAEPVVSGVRVASLGGAASWAVSDEGTMAYVVGRTDQDHLVLEVDRTGRVVRQLGDPVQGAFLSLSPDDSRLAMTTRTPANNDITVVNVADGRPERWTFAISEDETPIWSPDGTELAYSAAYTGRARHILRTGAPGVSGQDTVFTAAGHMHLTSWSPDGQWLLATQGGGPTGNDVWLVSADGSEQRPVLSSTFDESEASFSPDGDWVVYSSNQTGREELFATSFPDFEITRQVTTSGAWGPVWAPEVSEIIYQIPGTDVLQSIRYNLDDGFSTDPPQTLFDFASRIVFYEVTSNGESIIILTDNPATAAREIRVIQGFDKELERLDEN